MRALADGVMARRAASLFERVRLHLPASGTIADVGSGTGHNAAQVRRLTALAVSEFDVVDMHWVGPGPLLIDGSRLPAAAGEFDGLLLLFVLHYPESPETLLAEACRISRGPVIVVQSTYRGWWGSAVLGLREFIWGRLAWQVAAGLRLVPPGGGEALRPRRRFTRSELGRVFAASGLVIRKWESAEWPGLGVSRDLYVLDSGQQ